MAFGLSAAQPLARTRIAGSASQTAICGRIPPHAVEDLRQLKSGLGISIRREAFGLLIKSGCVLYPADGAGPAFIFLPIIGLSIFAAAHMNLPAFLRVHSDGVLLAVRLQPRSSLNQIGKALGHELRIKVTAPPVDAAANEALLRMLADALDCPRSHVQLIRGQTARQKTLKIYGLSAEQVAARLGFTES